VRDITYGARKAPVRPLRAATASVFATCPSTQLAASSDPVFCLRRWQRSGSSACASIARSLAPRLHAHAAPEAPPSPGKFVPVGWEPADAEEARGRKPEPPRSPGAGGASGAVPWWLARVEAPPKRDADAHAAAETDNESQGYSLEDADGLPAGEDAAAYAQARADTPCRAPALRAAAQKRADTRRCDAAHMRAHRAQVDAATEGDIGGVELAAPGYWYGGDAAAAAQAQEVVATMAAAHESARMRSEEDHAALAALAAVHPFAADTIIQLAASNQARKHARWVRK
jgi:hypothetical protein